MKESDSRRSRIKRIKGKGGTGSRVLLEQGDGKKGE